MALSPISFGRKIPITKYQIKDIKQNKFVNATLVQFDCKDYSDIEEMQQLSENWKYKQAIIDRMTGVYNSKDFKRNSDAFYALEDQNKK